MFEVFYLEKQRKTIEINHTSQSTRNALDGTKITSRDSYQVCMTKETPHQYKTS